MKPKTVLVLAILVLGLGAFVWFYGRDLPSSEELAARSRKVLPVESDDVTGVTLQWGDQKVQLERPGAKAAGAKGESEGGAQAESESAGAGKASAKREWRLAAPLADRADQSAVDRLLSTLTGLEKERTLDNVKPADAGLDSPRGKVTVTTAKGAQTLEIGADVPASNNLLVSLDGSPAVYVTSRSFVDQLQKQPGDWRSKDIFTAGRDRIAQVTLTSADRPDGPVVLAKRDGRFYLQKPLSDLADSEKVDRLLSSFTNLRATKFLGSGGKGGTPPALADLGLEPPKARIEARLAAPSADGTAGKSKTKAGAEAGTPAMKSPAATGGETLELDLGSPVEGSTGVVYARSGSKIFEASTDLEATAATPVADWRSRAWTDLQSYEVSRLAAERPGAGKGATGQLVLTREGTDWLRTAKGAAETIPYTAASDLLFAVTDAKGELPSSTPADLGKPILSLTLSGEKGAQETLTLFAAGDHGYPARSSTRDTLLLLPKTTGDGVLHALDAVRKAKPTAKDKDAKGK